MSMKDFCTKANFSTKRLSKKENPKNNAGCHELPEKLLEMILTVLDHKEDCLKFRS